MKGAERSITIFAFLKDKSGIAFIVAIEIRFQAYQIDIFPV